MKQALLEKGVPESAMTLDYAGFRTLDSIVRAKEVFQLENCLIITQQYHAVRALYIARKIDLQAIAFAAEDIEIKSVRQKNHLREKFARILAWLDMNILHTAPKFPK